MKTTYELETFFNINYLITQLYYSLFVMFDNTELNTMVSDEIFLGDASQRANNDRLTRIDLKLLHQNGPMSMGRPGRHRQFHFVMFVSN